MVLVWMFWKLKPVFGKIDLINQQVMEELLTKEEVLLSPHIAGWSSEAKEKMAQVIIKKLNVF